MRVSSCSSLSEIVVNVGYEANNEDIVFGKLEKLTLHSLTSLTSFCPKSNCNFQFPSLDNLVMEQCPKMEFFSKGTLTTPRLRRVRVNIEDEEDAHWEGDLDSTVRQLNQEMVGLHGQERLRLSEFPELNDKWLDEFSAKQSSNLKFLEVNDCTFASYAISSSRLLSLNNLKELRVTNCKSLEEIFDGSKDLQLRNRNVGLLSKLNKFYLADLPSLRHIWPDYFEQILVFKNLTMLNICNCSSLRYVFTPSMAPCLVQLQKIQVENCALMEEIFHNGEKEKGMGAGTVLKFPQLNCIILQSLPCLASFYYGNGVLDCPYLKKITIIDCPKMEMFISPSLRENVNIKESHKRLGGGDLYPSVKAFFSDKVVFPKLEELKLVGMDGLKMIWPNDHELHPKSFFRLKTLEIKKGGTSLLSIFPAGMLGRRLNNLEDLTVSKCESLEVISDVQTLKNGRESPHEVTDTQLTTLHISKLPKLKHVWNKDPIDELLSFENICSVVVKKCPTLTSLFPLSVALGLQELEKLQIKHCEGMEEIVSKMEVGRQEESCRPEFSFPNVTYLQLWGLPELKRFYKESHISEWPELNTLHVCHCEKFDVFGPEFQSIQDEACGEEQLHQQPFLSLIKIMPNLEDVCLMSKDIKMICDQGLVKGTKLKFLDLRCFDDASQVLPFASIERFPNLQKLTVVSSDFKQLFPSQLLSHKTNVKTLARIPELRLESLPEMTHIWDAESYQLNQILQNLESVKVLECHCLINLVPSTRALFPNLTYLDVWRCKQLVKLLASCTANSLMKLTEMRIRQCDSLAEIVASDHGDEATSNIEDIVFPKLKRLTLQSLTSLTSFCSATNCNFKFPSLYQMIAADCSKMEFFCQGVLSAPKLEEVRVKKEYEKEKKGRWEGDLNSTLRQLYKEMNSSTVRS